MSSRPKVHRGSPETKYRPKRINSNKKKTITGTFVATVNIEDCCDETNSNCSSWITEMESTKSQGTIDDVFEDTTLIIPGAGEYPSPKRFQQSDVTEELSSPETLRRSDVTEELSSPETLRRSEKQHDEWSLTHLHEDCITSPEKGAVGGTLETPERCQSPNSEQSPKGIISPLNIISPESDQILPSSETIAELLSKRLYDKDTELEFFRRRKKTKLSEINEEYELSSPETLRDSAKQHDDEWSLTHLYEDFENGDILSTPEKCQSPNSGKIEKKKRCSLKGTISPLKIFTHEIDPSLPNFETILEKLYDKDNTECQHEAKKSKLSHKSSEKRKKRMFNSTRIAPSNDTTSPPRWEMPDDVSSISCTNESKKKTEHKSGHTSIVPIENISFIKLPESETQNFLKTERKKSSQEKKLKKDMPKKHSFKALTVSSKESETLQSKTAIPSDKYMEDSQAKKKADCSLQKLYQGKNKDLSGTPTGARAQGEIKRRKIFLARSLQLKTSEESTLPKLKMRKDTEMRERTYVLAQKSSDKITTKQSEERGDIEKSREITKAPSLRNSEENVNEIVEEEVINDSDQSEKIATAEKTKKSLREEKAAENLFRNRSLSIVNSIAAEPAESENSWSIKIPEKQSRKSIKGSIAQGVRYSKKTSAIKIQKKKKLQNRKSKNESLEEDRTSAASSLVPIKDFIVSTESESITDHSRRTSESIVDHSSKGTSANDSLKTAASKKQKNKKRDQNRVTDESSEEEIVSTSSSTTDHEGSIEYMDDDTELKDATSEGSTEKFLEDMGLLESSNSAEEESVKTIEKSKKMKAERDIWKRKSLQEKIKEYTEYLNTLEIDVLSLRKWRDKKEKYKF